jgi:hypothetical protein
MKTLVIITSQMANVPLDNICSTISRMKDLFCKVSDESHVTPSNHFPKGVSMRLPIASSRRPFATQTYTLKDQ